MDTFVCFPAFTHLTQHQLINTSFTRLKYVAAAHTIVVIKEAGWENTGLVAPKNQHWFLSLVLGEKKMKYGNRMRGEGGGVKAVREKWGNIISRACKQLLLMLPDWAVSPQNGMLLIIPEWTKYHYTVLHWVIFNWFFFLTLMLVTLFKMIQIKPCPNSISDYDNMFSALDYMMKLLLH